MFIHLCIQSLRWLITWAYFVSIICMAGALLGMGSHLLYGLFFAADPDYAYLVAFGFKNGLLYAALWAGGASIVLCVIRARREFLQKQETVQFRDTIQ